jgi:hypothetical protein
MKKHKEFYVNREKALIPETTDRAVSYKAYKKLREIRSMYAASRDPDAIRIQAILDEECTRAFRGDWKDSLEHLDVSNMDVVEAFVFAMNYNLKSFLEMAGHILVETDQETETVRKYHCSGIGCRGFVDDTEPHCRLCNTTTCTECHEIVTNPDTHKCKPDDVKNIKLLNENTKNCPKCFTPIMKSDGCSMMWCTNCKTGFDYNTSMVLPTNTAFFHNPHHDIEVAEAARQVVANDDDGDIPLVGGRLYHKLKSYSHTSPPDAVVMPGSTRTLLYWAIKFTDVEYIPHKTLKKEYSTEDHVLLRVKYMVGEMSEQDFSNSIMLYEMSRRFENKVYQLVSGLLKDIEAKLNAFEKQMREVSTAKEDDLRELVGDAHKRIKHFNTRIVEVGKAFKKGVKKYDASRFLK